MGLLSTPPRPSGSDKNNNAATATATVPATPGQASSLSGTSGTSVLTASSTASVKRDIPAVANIPLQLVSDCQSRNVTVEMTSRDVFRGRLAHFDTGSMNLELAEVTCTKRDRSIVQMETVYLRWVKSNATCTVGLRPI